jgi:hypothetical protein
MTRPLESQFVTVPALSVEDRPTTLPLASQAMVTGVVMVAG